MGFAFPSPLTYALVWGSLCLSRFTGACYVSSFDMECGAVGQPTKVSIVFPITSNATGYTQWGDGTYFEDFVAANATGRQLIAVNDLRDNQLIFEHVYSAAGTYSLSFKIVVYPNETIDDNGWCIQLETPAPQQGDLWLLTVSENGCKEEFRSSAHARMDKILWMAVLGALGVSMTVLF